jgi:hypothetical protein
MRWLGFCHLSFHVNFCHQIGLSHVAPEAIKKRLSLRFINFHIAEQRATSVSGYHYQDDPVVRHAITEGIICAFLAKPFREPLLIEI